MQRLSPAAVSVAISAVSTATASTSVTACSVRPATWMHKPQQLAGHHGVQLLGLTLHD